LSDLDCYDVERIEIDLWESYSDNAVHIHDNGKVIHINVGKNVKVQVQNGA